MGRNALTIREMGEDVCWTLIQQAMGIKDAKMPSNFMKDRVALLLFMHNSLPERLCVTAAMRQMGGSTIFQGTQTGEWKAEVDSFQEALFPILGYFMDCLYLYGYKGITETERIKEATFPTINAGSPTSHPAHALADIACMLRVAKDLNGVQAAWIGKANGTLFSLVEASVFVPYVFNVALPPDDGEAEATLRQRVAELRARVNFARSPDEAVNGARFIFAGRNSAVAKDNFAITPELMRRADPEAKLLVSATPVRAIPVDPCVLASKASMIIRQSQYRLCVHKRILHWVFEKKSI